MELVWKVYITRGDSVKYLLYYGLQNVGLYNFENLALNPDPQAPLSPLLFYKDVSTQNKVWTSSKVPTVNLHVKLFKCINLQAQTLRPPQKKTKQTNKKQNKNTNKNRTNPTKQDWVKKVQGVIFFYNVCLL